jgi:hypothetical protein
MAVVTFTRALSACAPALRWSASDVDSSGEFAGERLDFSLRRSQRERGRLFRWLLSILLRSSFRRRFSSNHAAAVLLQMKLPSQFSSWHRAIRN